MREEQMEDKLKKGKKKKRAADEDNEGGQFLKSRGFAERKKD